MNALSPRILTAALIAVIIGWLCLPFAALAGPTLTTPPYAVNSAPTSAWVMVNGQQKIECIIATTAQGQVPTCDLTSLTRPGQYTLELYVSNVTASCTEAPALTWTCSDGGTVSSGPFSLTLRAFPAARPTVRLGS